MHLEGQGDVPGQIAILSKLPSSSTVLQVSTHLHSGPSLMKELSEQEKCIAVEVPAVLMLISYPTVMTTQSCLQILAVQGPADVAPQVYAKFLFTYVPIFARVSRRLEDLQVGLNLIVSTAPTET